VACFEAWLLGEVRLEDMLLWLTTIVSLEAIYIGLFLQNSSNRHGDANERQAAEDFRVNQEAKIDIEELMRRLSRLKTEKLDRLLTIQEMHFASVNPFFADLPKNSTPPRRKARPAENKWHDPPAGNPHRERHAAGRHL
jgi:Protein of unknown function (DUF1003)